MRDVVRHNLERIASLALKLEEFFAACPEKLVKLLLHLLLFGRRCNVVLLFHLFPRMM